MKVSADREKCQGYGNCVLAAPDVFDLDEAGLVRVLLENPPEELRDETAYAVRDCPVSALTLVD